MNIRVRLVRMIVTAAASLMILVPAHALAAVLWSAAPSTDLTDGVQSDGLTPPAVSQSLAPLGGPIIINKITWWGSYQDSNGDPLADGTPPYGDDFVVTFDNSLLVSTAGISKSIDPIGGGNLLTRYELSGLSLVFAAAPTTLDIINNFNDGNGSNLNDATWFWQGSGPNSRAYEIEGVSAQQQVPEPMSLLLLALGLAGLGAMRQRMRGVTTR